jgi:cyclophilin family peptidyl-prolyl cis-trans isomerase
MMPIILTGHRQFLVKNNRYSLNTVRHSLSLARQGGIAMNIRCLALLLLWMSTPLFAADIAYPKNEKNPRVEIKTNVGNIVVEVFVDRAPQSANYFLSNVISDFYRDSTFHRVAKDFIIQGGVYNTNLAKKAEKPSVSLEKTMLKNRRGTLAIARKLNDINSGNAEFFINVVDNPQLDYQTDKAPENQGFAVFAQVVQGIDVVDKIRKLPTTEKPGFGSVPNNPIIIHSIKRIDN